MEGGDRENNERQTETDRERESWVTSLPLKRMEC